MTRKLFYELEGIRPDGEKWTGEILGEQTLDEALSLAQHYANLWGSTVDLYRVPYLNLSSAPWATDELEFIHRVQPKPELVCRDHVM